MANMKPVSPMARYEHEVENATPTNVADVLKAREQVERALPKKDSPNYSDLTRKLLVLDVLYLTQAEGFGLSHAQGKVIEESSLVKNVREAMELNPGAASAQASKKSAPKIYSDIGVLGAGVAGAAVTHAAEYAMNHPENTSNALKGAAKVAASLGGAAGGVAEAAVENRGSIARAVASKNFSRPMPPPGMPRVRAILETYESWGKGIGEAYDDFGKTTAQIYAKVMPEGLTKFSVAQCDANTNKAPHQIAMCDGFKEGAKGSQKGK